MELLGFSDIGLFFLLFIPGFISLKIYDLLVPGQRRDFTSAALEVSAYGALNFAALSGLFFLTEVFSLQERHPLLFAALLFLSIFAVPIVWPFLWLKLTRLPAISSRFIHPMPKSWDYVFSGREPCWVRIHLKDGRVLGGWFGWNSFASSYPEERDLYVEQLWELDENMAFVNAVPGTKGVLLAGDEIGVVEFLR